MISRDKRVCIIDYGSGNVNSVYNIIKSLHDSVKISNKALDIEEATHLVLPGVGAFKTAMDKIRAMPTFSLIKDNVINKKKFFLGICVGMQVLADEGYEHEHYNGLGWISGKVNKIDYPELILPHVGWNNINIVKKDPLLEGLDSNADFYYVHSYHFDVANKENILATTSYGKDFVAIIRKDNIYGVQFHPEKSQSAGAILLKNFLSLS